MTETKVITMYKEDIEDKIAEYKEIISDNEKLIKEAEKGVAVASRCFDKEAEYAMDLYKKEHLNVNRHSKIMICLYNNLLGKNCKELNSILEKKIKDNAMEWMETMENQVNIIGQWQRFSSQEYIEFCNEIKDEITYVLEMTRAQAYRC